jgi:GDPmannose 4,6-dehydratase
MKTAFITGVNGQDGSLLAQYLLSRKDYKVVGMQRRTSTPTDWRLLEMGLYDNPDFSVCSGDLTDQGSIDRIIQEYKPQEVYNLAAQSFVGASWDLPLATLDITGLGAVRVFEAVRNHCKSARIYQASSSEMFGGARRTEVLNENSDFQPRSPYGVAKITAHRAAQVYKDSYGLFIVCGILFNHESEYRGIEFVTRKITEGVARIYLGLADHLELLSIDSERDWGYAPDFVRAMHLMIMNPYCEDFVIATGKKHSISDFLRAAFACIDIDEWHGYVRITGNERPADVRCLCGDSSAAYVRLGWKPTTPFEDMVRIMVERDIERLNQ